MRRSLNIVYDDDDLWKDDGGIGIHITITRLCNILRILTAVKMENFQMKKIVIFFLIFARNIGCGYKLEPPLLEPPRLLTIYVLEQK